MSFAGCQRGPAIRASVVADTAAAEVPRQLRLATSTAEVVEANWSGSSNSSNSRPYAGPQAVLQERSDLSAPAKATQTVSATKELAKLHRDGLRVLWPHHCQPRRTRSEVLQPSSFEQSPKECTRLGVGTSSSPDMAEALADLEELHRCGVPVVWPRGEQL